MYVKWKRPFPLADIYYKFVSTYKSHQIHWLFMQMISKLKYLYIITFPNSEENVLRNYIVQFALLILTKLQYSYHILSKIVILYNLLTTI